MDGQDDNFLELLDLYQDMIEKQDEIIHQLGKIVARQATDLKLMKNNIDFFDRKLEEDMNAAGKAVEQYQGMKKEIEP